MQRGMLILSKDEFNKLHTVIDINIFTGTPLFEKFNSALQSTEEEIKILMSEDEIERILDEVGPPISDDEVLNSALQKMSDLMMSFRSTNLPDLDSN